MKRIGVVSDTHLRGRGQALSPAVLSALSGLDAIVHCGDINEESVLVELETLAPVYAVSGNTDPWLVWNTLPDTRILTLCGVRVGVHHGDGPGRARDNALARFDANDVDVVLYGHSHCPEESRVGGIYCFNPGSPTRPRCSAYGTVGVLVVQGPGTVTGSWIRLDDA